jgi:outer membrane protein
MPLRKIFLFFAINTVVAILVSLTCMYILKPRNKIAVIDYDKVFANFNMSKEMKSEGEKQYSLKSKAIDSLYILLDSSTNAAANKYIIQQIQYEKENLQSYGESYIRDESAKIRTRINSYTRSFSEEKGYNLVLGMQQNGYVLYTEEVMQVTDEFLNYINSRYEGNK